MKKKYFLLIVTIITICILCVACGSTVPVEGTWYSVVDTTMYNFSEGKITVSGVTVGQYEDNGDSLVISMTADSTNLQLYVTQMNGIDVLADVKEGDGMIYFCKGLENAQMLSEDPVIWRFKQYLKENLVGTWCTENALHPQIEFFEDGTVKRTKENGEARIDKVVKDENGDVVYEITSETNKDGEKYAFFIFYLSEDGTLERALENGTLEKADDFWICEKEDTYTNDTLQMYIHTYIKQK